MVMGGRRGATLTIKHKTHTHTRTHTHTPQLYGADDSTAGVVPAGRQPGGVVWPQGGQMVATPQMLLGLAQPGGGGVMRAMGQPGLMPGGGGMDEAAMMQMGGYGVPTPMYAAYQPDGYGMQGAWPLGGMVGRGSGSGVAAAPAAAAATWQTLACSAQTAGLTLLPSHAHATHHHTTAQWACWVVRVVR